MDKTKYFIIIIFIVIFGPLAQSRRLECIKQVVTYHHHHHDRHPH